ncbi:MAG: 4Fe-4S dicluster domain-containing protein [Armatimonadota bacterium]
MSILKTIWSKIKEAIIALAPGRVTLPYPFAPRDPGEGFRGLPHVDVNRCIGCGGCANVCPARCIRVVDESQSERVLVFLHERCTFCGRCAEVCPVDAIEMSKEFELSTDDPHDDLVGEYHIFMGPCERCGRCFETTSALDRLQKTGMRRDTIDRKCAIACPADADADAEEKEPVQ